jgi:sortase A
MQKRSQKRTQRNYIFGAIICLGLIGFFSWVYLQNRPAQIYPSTHLPTASPSPVISEFSLSIPIIKVKAPVIANVDGNNQTAYDKALENGVAQLQGSSLPGQGGNIFIFGHSSFYWWSPGNYKTIFAKLPDIKLGDEIDVWYHQKEFQYKVNDIKTVLPNDVDVTKKTDSEELSLMTCVPVGTAQKRLIVTAKPE